MPNKSRRKGKVYCFYCGAVITSARSGGDHIPVPKHLGGRVAVPCCVSCHDMKDRIPLGDWPTIWDGIVARDFHNISRETRLFLAKAMRLVVEASAQLGGRRGE